jgi:pantetheine-phosphate adenylyltransferase
MRPLIAIFPGSFDPPTRGHLDTLERAAALFDRVVVGVLVNPAKLAFLPSDERRRLLEEEISLRGLANVEVRSFEGLAVRFAESAGAAWIVRGVRSSFDLIDESAMAATNRLAGKVAIETVFLPARPELAYIHARYVREIARGGGALSHLVTPAVEAALRRLAERSERR